MIRERTDLESDGVALVGHAFGGSTPRLRVNKLRTDSEKSVQKGTEQLLRGLFQAIRNPRSHRKYSDSRADANSIILFVDFLLRIIGSSVPLFSIELMLRRILDPEFVAKRKYADLLASEIPGKRRLDIFYAIFERIGQADGEKLRYFFDSLLSKMQEEEGVEVARAFSESFRDTEAENELLECMKAMPRCLWDKLSEAARLRLEQKVINSAREGRWIESRGRCSGGSFATWASDLADKFELKPDLLWVLSRKLDSDDVGQQDYVFRFFFGILVYLADEPPYYLCDIINRRLAMGDVRFKKGLETEWYQGEWMQPFEKALEEFEEAPLFNPGDDDDIPF